MLLINTKIKFEDYVIEHKLSEKYTPEQIAQLWNDTKKEKKIKKLERAANNVIKIYDLNIEVEIILFAFKFLRKFTFSKGLLSEATLNLMSYLEKKLTGNKNMFIALMLAMNDTNNKYYHLKIGDKSKYNGDYSLMTLLYPCGNMNYWISDVYCNLLDYYNFEIDLDLSNLNSFTPTHVQKKENIILKIKEYQSQKYVITKSARY